MFCKGHGQQGVSNAVLNCFPGCQKGFFVIVEAFSVDGEVDDKNSALFGGMLDPDHL